VKSPTRSRLEVGLQSALGRLRATGKDDKESVWVGTKEVLDWLYQCEEAEKTDAGYYVHRKASPEGCTLAGLIWLRGQLVHHQAEVQDAVMVPATLRRIDGTPLTLRRIDGTPLTVMAHALRWPSRSKLPDQERDRHHRDTYYERYVQGQELLPPLERAALYLIER
jgi:hypothetical protein